MNTDLLSQANRFASHLSVTRTDADEPDLKVATAVTGACNTSRAGSSSPMGSASVVHGTGVGFSADEAFIPAIAEALERYSISTFYDEQFVWASAASLDDLVLDLDTIPRCSDSETANPRCPLTLPDKTQPIRWVKGLSLHDGKPIWLPAVMTYLHAGWRAAQERFWLPLSTGCAAHRSYESAVINGLCEVVERDAISLTWLQELNLPRIVVDEPGPSVRPYWELYQQSTADIEYHFFNATSDVQLPTVYGIQVSRNHPYARTIVACASAMSFDQALAKVIKDFVALKRAFTVKREIPRDISTFTHLLDGATYMARPENAHAFDFLLNTGSVQSLRSLSSEVPCVRTLPEALEHFANLNLQVIAVDLSTDEAIRSGLRVVRIVIPQLQPLSVHASAQYLGHPRLYDAPVHMGYASRPETALNKWPQPFA